MFDQVICFLLLSPFFGESQFAIKHRILVGILDELNKSLKRGRIWQVQSEGETERKFLDVK